MQIQHRQIEKSNANTKTGYKHPQHCQRSILQQAQITTDTDIFKGYNKVMDM